MKLISLALIFLSISAIYAAECSAENPFGALADDKWTPLVNTLTPCPDNKVDLGAKYTISFDYKIVGTQTSEWLDVFRFTETNNNCCNAKDRTPALYIHKNGYLHLTLATDLGGNYWQNTYTDWPKEGRFTIVYHKQIFSLYAGEKQLIAQFVGNNVHGLATFKYGAGTAFQDGILQTKNWKLQVGQANHPGVEHCDQSPFGHYSTSKWTSVVRGTIPCPHKVIARRSTRYTIEFEYKPVQLNAGWTNIFRITPKSNKENSARYSRNPSVWVYPNQFRLHWRQSTTSGANSGIDTLDVFKVGQTYKIRLIADSNRFTVVIDGQVSNAHWQGHIDEAIDAVVYVSDIHHDASVNQYRNFKFYNNQVLYPGAAICKENWAGLYSTDNWLAPVSSYQPCPSVNYQYTNKNTITFDYKPQGLNAGWTNLYRITANSDRDSGQIYDRVNVLYVRPNSYNLVINLSTSKHANYGVDFSYDFKSDISYAIKIVSNVNMLSVYVDGIRVNHVDVGDVRSFGLVKLFLSDRWLPAPNALIKNFNFQNGVEDCITIYSECDYKGVEHEVCGDNPDLRASGFDYVVKSVQIPADYDRTVTLWTETGYKAKKLELTQSAPCIKPDHYKAILAQVEGASKSHFKQYITMEKKQSKQ